MAHGADAYRTGLQAAEQRGCTAFLVRLAWSDFETLCELHGRRLEPGWRDDNTKALAEVAGFLELRGPVESVTRMRLGGRPALGVSARRFHGHAVLVVAPGVDLAYFHFYAPDERALRRAGSLLRAMLAAARLRGSGPVTPLPLRRPLSPPPDPEKP